MNLAAAVIAGSIVTRKHTSIKKAAAAYLEIYPKAFAALQKAKTKRTRKEQPRADVADIPGPWEANKLRSG